MEMSIKTMIIVVLGVLALIILVTIFASAQGQSGNILSGIFDYFKVLGGGAGK